MLSAVLPVVVWGFTGVAVAIGWVIQIWANKWEPIACRRDRAGRVLGALWTLGPVLALLLCLWEEIKTRGWRVLTGDLISVVWR
jgi:hypothetical protein